MKKLTLFAAALTMSLTVTSPSLAELYEWEGGEESPPTENHRESRVNAGVGNGAEGINVDDEREDLDPGKSYEHNRAGNNYDKPRSAKSGN